MQLNEEEIEEKYGENSLAPEMTDEMYKLVYVHQAFMYECVLYKTSSYVPTS